MSNLNITVRHISSVVVVDLAGQIRLGLGNIDLHRKIRELVESGEKHVVLNLADVSHIDSSGLGELVAGYASLQKNGGELKLLNLNDRAIELMTITKLFTVFDVFDDETAAINSFDTTAETAQPLDGDAAEQTKASSIL
jgi:anti-sigma B factor antagonist